MKHFAAIPLLHSPIQILISTTIKGTEEVNFLGIYCHSTKPVLTITQIFRVYEKILRIFFFSSYKNKNKRISKRKCPTSSLSLSLRVVSIIIISIFTHLYCVSSSSTNERKKNLMLREKNSFEWNLLCSHRTEVKKKKKIREYMGGSGLTIERRSHIIYSFVF